MSIVAVAAALLLSGCSAVGATDGAETTPTSTAPAGAAGIQLETGPGTISELLPMDGIPAAVPTDWAVTTVGQLTMSAPASWIKEDMINGAVGVAFRTGGTAMAVQAATTGLDQTIGVTNVGKSDWRGAWTVPANGTSASVDVPGAETAAIDLETKNLHDISSVGQDELDTMSDEDFEALPVVGQYASALLEVLAPDGEKYTIRVQTMNDDAGRALINQVVSSVRIAG